MTIGSAIYIPGSGFSFPRSYVDAFAVDEVYQPMLQGAPHFIFRPTESPEIDLHIVLLDEFYAWSSNTYTLDFVLTDVYYSFHPDTAQIPYPFRLEYLAPTPTKPAALYFRKQGSFSTPHYYDLPSRSSPYWLPQNF